MSARYVAYSAGLLLVALSMSFGGGCGGGSGGLSTPTPLLGAAIIYGTVVDAQHPDQGVANAYVYVPRPYARQVENAISWTHTGTDGSYELIGLPEGEVTLRVEPPPDCGYWDLEISGLSLAPGQRLMLRLTLLRETVEVTAVEVTPSYVELAPGHSQTFEVTLRDGQGNPLTGIRPTWTVNGTIGAIGDTGQFTAGAAEGYGSVTATVGTVHGSASVRVTEQGGGTQNYPPSATLSVTPQSGVAPLMVTFDGSGSDPENSIVAYRLEFGDGTAPQVTATAPTGFTHVYADPGTYTAVLTVTDAGGLTASDDVAVTVTASGQPSPTPTPTSQASATPAVTPTATPTPAPQHRYHFVTTWGSRGSADGQFYAPWAVAVDSDGNVYVADSYNRRIQKFGPDGTFLRKWGSPGLGDGQFGWLAGVAVDAAGNVYVADMGNDRVQSFTSDGAFLTKWASHGLDDGQFDRPRGVAVDAAGNVYVADFYNDRIQKFTSDGRFLMKWGAWGPGDGQFEYPEGVAVDSAGNVYVADSYNHRIQKFTSDGTFLTKWGCQGSARGQFDCPEGVAVDSAGNVYVGDSYNHRIQKFTSSGGFLASWGSQGTGDGQFRYPQGVAVDSAGNVYVADLDNHRIQVFAPEQ